MRKKMRTLTHLWMSMNVAAGLCFGVVPSALAHPGHGVDSSGVGLLHFLLEISHGGSRAILVVATTFAIACIGIANPRSRARK
jgi:hypothetical protein